MARKSRKLPSPGVCLAAVVLLMLATLPASGLAASLRPEQVVTLSRASIAAPARAGAPVLLRITALIAPGWHINSNQPSDSYYIPTRLAIGAPESVRVLGVDYPPAKKIAPAFMHGKQLAVFTGAPAFAAGLSLRAGAAAPRGPIALAVSLDYQACNDVQCLRPVTIRRTFDLKWPLAAAAQTAAGPRAVLQPSAAGGPQASTIFAHYGLLVGFLLVLVGGIALNLTPCVYPLIGVTIAYFGNQGGGGTRRVLMLALLYVAGIALMFSAVGTVVALSGGLFGALLQNPYVLSTIALLMLLLAASSFGLFSLQPPAWMMRRFGSARPGYLGAFGMGVGMGVVAAPCIGPFVLGLLLVVEQAASPLFGFAVFFVLAVGLGLPYVALALAAGSIRRLPRSGEWLAWVEHLFGFILIGLALYFIDPLTPNHLAGRLLPYYAAIVGLYMGFVSPIGESLRPFQLMKYAVGGLSAVALVLLLIPKPKRPMVDFTAFSQTRMSQAIARRKPILIDFWASWCIPCREMDATTFSNPAVVREARKFVTLRADLTRSDGVTDMLIKVFDIQGVPTTVLVNPQGQVEKRMVGFVGPEEMVASLKKVD